MVDVPPFCTQTNTMNNIQYQQQAAASQQTEYYSGQWTKEEQDYVACLVDGFKNGTLDIPDGTSLRFFIAAKLGCKPKRVSKKYERSGYNGKQVYRRDSNVPAKDLEVYRQRLKDSEKAFKDSRALVVSMQESKQEPSSRSPVTETPVISLHSSNLNASALENRLQAMRNQIDLRTTNLLGYPPVQVARYNLNTGTSMMAGGPLNPAVTGPMSPEVIQAMMIQRQRAAALSGAGFSTGFPSTGLPTAGPSTGPTNKLLIDLYQRRQQLIMSYMAAGGATAGTPQGAGLSAMGFGRSSPLAVPASHLTVAAVGVKRDLQDLEAEEQARKRARAA